PLVGTSPPSQSSCSRCRAVGAYAFLVMQNRSPPFGREAHPPFHQSFFRRKTMFRKFLIKKDERGLLFRKGDFVTVLHAGEHRYFDPFYRLTVEKYPLVKTVFDHPLAR